MSSELDDLLAQFPDWTAALDAWEKRIPRVDYWKVMTEARGTGRSMDEVVRAGQEAIRQAGEKPNVLPVIERICRIFLTATPVERGRIHQAFATNRTMRVQLESLYAGAALRLHSHDDAEVLRVALAAVVIEDAHGRDWRDTTLSLMGLAQAAAAAGIDHRPYVAEALALWETMPRVYTDDYNAAKMLRRFVGPTLPW